MKGVDSGSSRVVTTPVLETPESRSSPSRGFSLVIPAWNEESRLQRTLEQYLPVFSSHRQAFEIIVVMDGCTDGTKAVADRWSDRGVRVLEFPQRLGKGAAIFKGLDIARFDRVGFADADGSVSAEDVLRVVSALDGSDCAIASRRAVGASVRIAPGWMRSSLSRVWNLLVRGVLLLPYSDTQCGVKFLRRSAYVRVRDRTVSFGDWAFDVGLLFLLHQSGQTIAEVPVSWAEEGGSKFDVLRDVPRMFESLVGIRFMGWAGSNTMMPTLPASPAGTGPIDAGETAPRFSVNAPNVDQPVRVAYDPLRIPLSNAPRWDEEHHDRPGSPVSRSSEHNVD